MNFLNKKFFLVCLLFIFSAVIITNAFSVNLDVSGIRAYPVPFNPKKHNLTIDHITGGNNVKVEIFDINGDEVFVRSYSSVTEIKWNGRNNGGRTVRPGLYIIKITVEDSSGAYGKKIIRILVNS